MGPIRRRRFAVAALLLLPAVPAAGGHIALQLTSTAELTGGALRVAVTVTNVGNEAARAVRPRLSLGSREMLGPPYESLGPGQSFDLALLLPVPGLGAGRWPFRLAVAYEDANSHPFETLQVASVVVGSPAPLWLEFHGIETPPLTGPGAVRVRLRNAGAGARQAAIALFAPRDLEVEESAQRVAIGPGEQVELSLRVAPRTALAGSRYAVYVVVEHDEAGIHQALVGETVLEVRERGARLAPALWAASALFMVVWVVAVRRHRAKKQNSSSGQA